MDAITDIPGITVGQAQDDLAETGCTVVLCPEGAVVGAAVRGLASGTREVALCRPGTLVERAHAVLLTGGSAFGLDAAAGVMRYLAELGAGFPTSAGPVPIVPAAVLYDLEVGEARWPDAEMAYAACRAQGQAVAEGRVGAGRGATVGKILGMAGAMWGGVGTASLRVADYTVGAIVAVNTLGDVVNPAGGHIVAGARDPRSGAFVDTWQVLLGGVSAPPQTGNTTIGVIATDASLDPVQVEYLAKVGHNGLARTIRPAHTPFDGDTLFALAVGTDGGVGWAEVMRLGVGAVQVVEEAVLRAVRHSTPLR